MAQSFPYNYKAEPPVCFPKNRAFASNPKKMVARIKPRVRAGRPAGTYASLRPAFGDPRANPWAGHRHPGPVTGRKTSGIRIRAPQHVMGVENYPVVNVTAGKQRPVYLQLSKPLLC